MSHTTLRQAAFGVIAILAVVLMLEASGSAVIVMAQRWLHRCRYGAAQEESREALN